MYRIKVYKWIYLKKHGERTDNPSVRINVNNIENRITFKIKTRYYPELLTSETMKLFGRTKNKIIKDEKNIPHLEIIEIVLVYCNIVNNDYLNLFFINHFVNY